MKKPNQVEGINQGKQLNKKKGPADLVPAPADPSTIPEQLH